jgi:hypothetical protein
VSSSRGLLPTVCHSFVLLMIGPICSRVINKQKPNSAMRRA